MRNRCRMVSVIRFRFMRTLHPDMRVSTTVGQRCQQKSDQIRAHTRRRVKRVRSPLVDTATQPGRWFRKCS